MNLLKKAQGATEYLIILAVVIIIALIVVGVMGGIPGIGGGSKSSALDAYWATLDVAIDSAALAGTTATLNLRNNQRNAITVDSVMLGSNSASPALTLNSGQTGSVSLTLASACAAGTSYSYNVSIGYTDNSNGAGYNFTSSQNLEGSCASS